VKSFRDRVAVITGGASGIGRAMADRFAREGMRIVLADIEGPALKRAVAEMKASGATVIGVRTDVSQAAQVQALADQALGAFGAVHIVCNNAGVGGNGGPSWQLTEPEWKWVLDVNLWGVIHGVRTFVPILLEQEEGHVVNTASLAGLLAPPGIAPYNASKFGVVALTEALYQELAATGRNVRASVLCPAGVKTNILDSGRNRPAGVKGGGVGAPEAIRSQVEKGLDPAVVADRVVDAIREDRLYILTHPEFNDSIRQRTEYILKG
jgi:NAD(P)-dependent dehydrogenase (short-subunit alcohol dehydrogenase family)